MFLSIAVSTSMFTVAVRLDEQLIMQICIKSFPSSLTATVVLKRTIDESNITLFVNVSRRLWYRLRHSTKSQAACEVPQTVSWLTEHKYSLNDLR